MRAEATRCQLSPSFPGVGVVCDVPARYYRRCGAGTNLTSPPRECQPQKIWAACIVNVERPPAVVAAAVGRGLEPLVRDANDNFTRETIDGDGAMKTSPRADTTEAARLDMNGGGRISESEQVIQSVFSVREGVAYLRSGGGEASWLDER